METLLSFKVVREHAGDLDRTAREFRRREARLLRSSDRRLSQQRVARSGLRRHDIAALINQDLHDDSARSVRGPGDGRIRGLWQVNRFTVEHPAADGVRRRFNRRRRRHTRVVIVSRTSSVSAKNAVLRLRHVNGLAIVERDAARNQMPLAVLASHHDAVIPARLCAFDGHLVSRRARAVSVLAETAERKASAIDVAHLFHNLRVIFQSRERDAVSLRRFQSLLRVAVAIVDGRRDAAAEEEQYDAHYQQNLAAP